MSRFWGEPTFEPEGKEVAKFVEAIRKLTEKQGEDRCLRTATSAVEAIVLFIADRHGPREALAILGRLNDQITKGSQ